MAVFTEVSFDEVETFLRTRDLGHLLAIEACGGGIENTNYFVETDVGAYVLTLFERLGADELPFYLHLMQHLARKAGLEIEEIRRDVLLVEHEPASLDTGGKGSGNVAGGFDAGECHRRGVYRPDALKPG